MALAPCSWLSERLDRGTASKLVLVSAPAGFGKTTLALAEWWRRDRPRRPAAGPRGLRRTGPTTIPFFWTYVIAALRMVAAGAGEAALALLQAPQRS